MEILRLKAEVVNHVRAILTVLSTTSVTEALVNVCANQASLAVTVPHALLATLS